MQRTRLVLPAPFSPARATSSPLCTLRLMSRRARTGPYLTFRPETVSRGARGPVLAPACTAPAPAGTAAAALWAASPAAMREPVMPSLCGLNRAVGHKVPPPCGPDRGFSLFLNVKPGLHRGGARGHFHDQEGSGTARSTEVFAIKEIGAPAWGGFA